MVFTEFNVVEKPIIEWLGKIGWKYLPSDELKRDIEEPFDLASLTDSLVRLNPDLDDEDVDKVVNQLRRVSNDVAGNREFLEWLKGERSLVLKPGEKAKTVKLIDSEDLDKNNFVVTNQFKFAGYERVRPDILLMVNGIPLVVIEGKVPTREFLDYHEAIKQIVRYAREAPQLLKYLAFTCPTDGTIFKYGWANAEGYQKFFEWKNEKLTDPVEAGVRGLFGKEQFLDLATNFIVFEKDPEGKVA